MFSSPYLRILFAALGMLGLQESHMDSQVVGREELSTTVVSASRTNGLILASSDTAISADYGLSVVRDVPPPPVLFETQDSLGLAICPLQVRAIVVSELPSQSIAVVARGGESWLVRQGQRVRIAARLVSVETIASNTIVLQQDNQRVYCQLQK